MDTFLLLQVRNADDPMRQQEVECFARALQCDVDQIRVYDLLSGVPTLDLLDHVDVVLLGGSGDYSVAEGGDWLPPVLESMRALFDLSKPTFASCWGFQALAKAMGGNVVTDMSRAELGTVEVFLTDEGLADPLFAPLGDRFLAPHGAPGLRGPIAAWCRATGLQRESGESGLSLSGQANLLHAVPSGT